MPLKETMRLMKTSNGSDVLTLSNDELVLLIFLRHFGCVFCRQSLVDLAERKNVFFKEHVTPVFVHMTDNATAESYFEQYGLKGSIHVSDPGCAFYLAFGLVKGRFSQLFGLKNAVKGFEIATKGIYPTLTQVGDGTQMPGMFMISKGHIEQSFIHKYAADKPDYDQLIACCHYNSFLQ
jgi:peroxiredoxin